MWPTLGNVSEECNTTFEQIFWEHYNDFIECFPQNASLVEIERCECEVLPGLFAEMEKISTNPGCQVITPWIAEGAILMRKKCWVHNSDSVCQELVVKATSPLEEQNAACLSRAAGGLIKHEQCECERQHQLVIVFQAFLQIPEATQCTYEPLGEVVTQLKLVTLHRCGIKRIWGPCFEDVYDAALQEEMSSCVNGVDWQRCDCQLLPKIIAAYEGMLAVPGPVQCGNRSYDRDERSNLERNVDSHRGELAKCA